VKVDRFCKGVTANFGKFKTLREGIGLWNTCLYLMARLCSSVGGGRLRIVKYYFMAQPVPFTAADETATTGAFRVDWAHPRSDLFTQVERPAATIAARFAQGACCLAATTGESQLAGFLWFIVGPYDEDEVRVRFIGQPAGKVAWDFDVTIMPRYRMGRLFTYLWHRASKELRARGIVQTVSRISAFNIGSLASHRRLGAREVGEASFLCVGGLQIMKSTLAPKWHVSWREDQRPVLHITC